MEHIKYYCDFQRKIKEFLQELPNRMTELLDSAAKLEKGRLAGTVIPELEESLQRLHASKSETFEGHQRASKSVP